MSEIKVNSIKGVGASAAAITVNNTDGTCTANITNNLSNRNLIINGAMQVAQRGTSFTSATGYTLDRWSFDDAMSAGVATLSQSTTSPDGFANSLKVDITSADTSLAGGEYSQVYQYIEAQNLQHLAYGTSAAKTVTISFYVRSNKTGGYNFAILQSDASSRLVSFQYTINSANTWERKSFTIAGDASGQIDNDTGIGYALFWGLAYGGNYTSGSLQSSFTSYSAANFGAGQAVNLFDSTSNEWYITGVQLEVGSVATDFEHRSIAQELELCKRYYYIVSEESGKYFNPAYTYVNGLVYCNLKHPVQMRTTASLEQTTGTAYYRFYYNGSYTNFTGFIKTDWSTKDFATLQIGPTQLGTTLSDKTGAVYQYDAAGHVAFNAEL